MGRNQRAESSGLISCVVCAVIGYFAMTMFRTYAPAIWQLTQRTFTACSGIAAGCAVVSFIIGYTHFSRSLREKHHWYLVVRRLFEVLALSVVYGSTIFLTSFMFLDMINSLMGKTMTGYLPAICAAFSGIVGYLTFVQAELMNAKTLASLLPFFIIAGVSTAGSTSDDPYWANNNFSQLGDRTTFAARMFNSTLMLGGICIIIISYFSISELVANYRQRLRWHGDETKLGSGPIPHFAPRTVILGILLALAGIEFFGIGMFRYTPHPVLHNVFARSLPGVMGILMLALPWLAPQLSKAVYVISDLAIVVCAYTGIIWLEGENTLTNVEAFAGLLFLGWFVVFTRQIAAIETDRVQAQLLHAQYDVAASGNDADAMRTVPIPVNVPVTRASKDDVEAAKTAGSDATNDNHSKSGRHHWLRWLPSRHRSAIETKPVDSSLESRLASDQ